jgi:hypothetical protein
VFVDGCVRSAGRGDDRLVAREGVVGSGWWGVEGLLWVVVWGRYLVLVCLT